MQSHNISRRQLGAWLFAALSAPLAQIAGGVPWLAAVLLGTACLTVCWLLGRNTVCPGKWVCIVEFAWIVCVLGGAARWIAGSWPIGNAYPAVPLVLLALAAASAAQGTAQAARAGGMVFWLLALVYCVVVFAGIGEADIKMIESVPGTADTRLIVVFLVPALIVFVPKMQRKLSFRGLAAICGFAVAISVLIAGSLSSTVAQSVDMPLYDWVRGLSLFDTVQRFEAIVSVALTMGWFSLLSFQMSVAGHLADRVNSGWYRMGVWVCAAMTGLSTLPDGWIRQDILAVGSIVLWVIIPFFCAAAGKIKKSGNFKNCA